MTHSEQKVEPTAEIMQGVYAVVGCDGTGKSTLTADLMRKLAKEGPVKWRYLGLVSGETGDKIKKLPFFGIRLERYLNRKAQRAQDMKKKLPGNITSLIMYLLSWWRAWHLLKVRKLAKKGNVVIVDRFPQAEIPGFHYDGPGLTTDRTSSWFIQKLAIKEQKLYEWMSSFKPQIVIRLNIDVDTAFSRKPDHDKTELKEKIAVMPRLNYNEAHMVDIDSRKPYQQVLDTAVNAISEIRTSESSR